jgi:hypothetical protein
MDDDTVKLHKVWLIGVWDVVTFVIRVFLGLTIVAPLAALSFAAELLRAFSNWCEEFFDCLYRSGIRATTATNQHIGILFKPRLFEQLRGLENANSALRARVETLELEISIAERSASDEM